VKCFDTVDMGWSRVADVNASTDKQLLGCSFNSRFGSLARKLHGRDKQMHEQNKG